MTRFRGEIFETNELEDIRDIKVKNSGKPNPKTVYLNALKVERDEWKKKYQDLIKLCDEMNWDLNQNTSLTISKNYGT